MTPPIKVLHITPHLGGGVGKALQTLATAHRDTPFEHAFLLLERPEKPQFLDALSNMGCEATICPDAEVADQLISVADVVQLEWWNHPATFKFLCERVLPPMRLLVWCHVSGLHEPLIPPGLIERADRFIFTSPCSYQAPNVCDLAADAGARFGMVSSGVGLFGDRSPRPPTDATPMRVGYMGSLNFSKFHPKSVEFFAAVSVPDFRVNVWGDDINRDVLLQQCASLGKPQLLQFAGYTTDVADVLSNLDVFVYLLNPLHYGTAENVLLEAMSAGAVPVVLGNPAERAIVEDGETGWVVDSPDAFAAAIDWLSRHSEDRRAMGKNAAAAVSANHTPAKMGAIMGNYYLDVLAGSKHRVAFGDALGSEPLAWYQACRKSQAQALSADLAEYETFGAMERTKGSLQHFLRYFPDSPELKLLAGAA